MIRLVCKVEDFLTQEPVADCSLKARVIVAPRLFGTLPNLALAQVLSKETRTPSDGLVTFEFNAADAFDTVERLIREGSAAGTPVAFAEFRARCDGLDRIRGSRRSLARDDTFEATISLDFAKSIVGHTTPTSTTLWFCLHKPEREGENYFCEIDTTASANEPVPLQRHRVHFPQSDASTTVVRVTGLEPATRYLYVLRQSNNGQTEGPRQGRRLTAGEFETFSAERDAQRLRFAFASCHSPVHHEDLSEGIETVSHEALERWAELGTLGTSQFDMLLLTGDQIYADGIEKNFPRDSWLTRFTKRYHQQWEYREVRRVLNSRPTYMILDDHEVKDDFGTTTDLSDTIVEKGLKAYRLFQHSHNPGGPDGPFHYHFRRGPAAFFVLDTRTHRTPNPEDADFPVIGPRQLDDLKSWAASEEARTADVIVFVTSVPLAWLPMEVIREAVDDLSEETGAAIGLLTSSGSFVIGAIGYEIGDILGGTAFKVLLSGVDVEDQWTFGPNQRDLQRVLRLLFDLANDLDPATGERRPGQHKRAVFVISGDVHMGGAHVIRSHEDGSGGTRDHRPNPAIYSLTSSPISHRLPDDLRIFQKAVRHASDNIDANVLFLGRLLDLEVSDDSLLDVLGRKPASFVLDSEGEKLYRADLLGLMPTRNYGLFSMRRLESPGRQYEFSFSIQGPKSAVRSEFTMNLDATTVVPVPTSPGLTFTPDLVNFGGVPVGTEARRTLVIKNISGDGASISIAATPLNALFRWAGVNRTLGHGQEQQVEIVFRPTGHEIVRSELTITSSALERPRVIGIIGKGPGGFPEPGPEPEPIRKLTFTPTSINFGSVPLNNVRRRSLTIQNGTSAPIRISIKAAPANLPFAWEAFEVTLFGGSQRTVEVRFRPQTNAIVRATLVVTSTASDSPKSIPLVGKGPGGF